VRNAGQLRQLFSVQGGEKIAADEIKLLDLTAAEPETKAAPLKAVKLDRVSSISVVRMTV
jgi:hypothetical protein